MASLAAQIAAEVLRASEGGPPLFVATVIDADRIGGGHAGQKMLVRQDGTTLGTLGAPVLDAAVVRDAAAIFRRHGTRTVHYSESGESVSRQEAGGRPSFAVMVEVHERPVQLLIAGGGHIGRALAQLGAMCGFRVTVVDDRPEYANAARFPDAEVLRGRFDEVLAAYPMDDATYAVCVTRGHRHDEISLRNLVGRGAAYVGMIGSRRRVKAVLQHLVEDGADPADVDAVQTPIGLDIGAETPEEIAVAIMAEIIMHRRGGTGAPMKR
jgi:xanthine dehydrogenase accessory factor